LGIVVCHRTVVPHDRIPRRVKHERAQLHRSRT
jgi:hypothetical protein